MATNTKLSADGPRDSGPLWPYLVLIPFLAFGVVRIYWGRCWGDEGWYLLATRNVLAGKVPYADFMFTQMPLLPYVYALPMAAFGQSLIVARWVSLVFSAASIVLVMRACRKRASNWGAFIAGALLGLNLNFAFYGCILRSQPLTVFLTTCSLYFAASRPLSVPRAAAGVLFMVLAVGVRLSMAPALAVLGIFLLVVLRNRLGGVILMGVGAAVLLGGLMAVFWAGGNMLFGIYRFHSEWYGFPAMNADLVKIFTITFLANQLPLVACTVCAVAILVANWRPDPGRGEFYLSNRALLLMLLAGYVLTTLVHISRPVSQATYQISNITFLTMISGLVLGHWLREHSPRYVIVTLVLAMTVLGMAAQQYPVDLEGKGAHGKVRDAVANIRNLSDKDDPILTLAVELAVESDRPLLSGYEMSEFSHFPDMASDRAERLKVVNFERVMRDITGKKAKLICLTPRDLSVILSRKHGETVKDALLAHYVVKAKVDDYGQFLQTMYIFEAKPPK